MKQTAVVVISGGMDSATLLYWYRRLGYRVKAISFDYGQRHSKELEYAIKLTIEAGMPANDHRVVSLPIGDLMSGSSQTDRAIAVPEGHYAAENMKKTVVPNRNMVMLAIAGSWAVNQKAAVLAYGAHAGDHTIYPDCRETFIKPLAEAFLNCDWHPVALEAPFVKYTKGQIAAIGAALGVPFEKTWTCYKGLALHCGKCGACQERQEAFEFAGIKDPTIYEEAMDAIPTH